MKKLVYDVGGTFIKYALMDDDAKIYDKGKIETPKDTKEHFMDTIESIYKQYRYEVDGLAFSLPGNIDTETGYIYTPGALMYNANTNFFDTIHSRIDLPVSVENDGKSAALAELWKGNLKDVQDGAVLILGTGVGGGFIHHRKLLKGKHFFSGEVSFLMTNFEVLDFYHAFGLKGSATGLIMEAATRKNIDPSLLDGKKIFAGIEEGDKDYMEALDVIARNIAAQIYNIQCFLDPERVCIGGGISKQPLLLEKIKENLEMIKGKIPVPFPDVDVTTCAFYNDSNLIGALYNYNIHHGGK